MSKDLILCESGLRFTLEQNKTFLPEQEPFYKSLSAKVSIKICDIVYLNPTNELLLIELKSSSPRESQEFVQEIKQKFVDTLLLYIGTVFNRKNTPSASLPPTLNEPSSLQKKIRLVLIVKGHKRAWLPPLHDSLRKECRALEKLFSLEETQVYNQQLASQKLGLIIEE
ncbi:MAG: hypothetical protein AAF702_23915 [Chloroflexota bacterium]